VSQSPYHQYAIPRPRLSVPLKSAALSTCKRSITAVKPRKAVSTCLRKHPSSVWRISNFVPPRLLTPWCLLVLKRPLKNHCTDRQGPLPQDKVSDANTGMQSRRPLRRMRTGISLLPSPSDVSATARQRRGCGLDVVVGFVAGGRGLYPGLVRALGVTPVGGSGGLPLTVSYHTYHLHG
jgi:hypothetical protein